MASKKQRVFVYGTLRTRGQPATHVLRADMFDSGSGYPFIKPGNGTVFGEIREVTATRLKEFDRYEGYNPKDEKRSLYLRVKATVHAIEATEQASPEEVWVYVAGPRFTYKPIAEGDWRAYIERQPS